MDDSLDTSGIWPIKEYIQSIQSTIVAQVDCRIIYEMCTGAERIRGYSRFIRWWDQDLGQEEELPRYYCSFKNNCVGAVP